MRSASILFRLAPAALFLLSSCVGVEDPTLLPAQPKEQGEFSIKSAELLQAESWPVQIFLEIAGTLPSACHTLDYAVILPDADGIIEVEAQAKLDEDAECSEGAQPFRQGIGLGSYTDGEFVVLLNGEQVGKVHLGTEVQEPEPEGIRGPVYVDEAELIILESFPVQVELAIRGALPTPCASLEWRAEPADDDGRIFVEVFSLQVAGLDCIQVLAELDERLPIGSYTEGSYSVWLNGELIGEFEV